MRAEVTIRRTPSPESRAALTHKIQGGRLSEDQYHTLIRDIVECRYPDGEVAATHPFARRFDAECRRAEQVLYAASNLKQAGFEPDLVVAHPGCSVRQGQPARSRAARSRGSTCRP